MVEEIDYITAPQLSYSGVKRFIKKGLERKDENMNLVIGDIVDKILTEGKKLEDLCMIENVNIPRKQIETFSKNLFQLYIKDLIANEFAPLPINPDYYENAYIESEIKAKKLDKILEEFESNREYFDFLVERTRAKYNGIIVINQEERRQVDKCIDDITNSSFNKFFSNEDLCFNQLEIITETYKIKLDSLYIENGIIYLKDLKTTGSFTINSVTAVVDYRYDIQAYLYHKVIKMILKGEKFTTNSQRFVDAFEYIKTCKLSNTFDFIFVSKNFICPVFELKYKIEKTKDLLGKILYTKKDINKALKMWRTCTYHSVKPNLNEYYALHNYSFTI